MSVAVRKSMSMVLPRDREDFTSADFENCTFSILMLKSWFYVKTFMLDSKHFVLKFVFTAVPKTLSSYTTKSHFSILKGIFLKFFYPEYIQVFWEETPFMEWQETEYLTTPFCPFPYLLHSDTYTCWKSCLPWWMIILNDL